MNFQIIAMEQRDKTVYLKIIGISPLENVSNLDKLKEQMKSEISDMKEDEKKMMMKFMTPWLLTVSKAMEMDNPQPFRDHLTTTLILDEEQFEELKLKLGDFITFQVTKLDRAKLSIKPPQLGPEANTEV